MLEVEVAANAVYWWAADQMLEDGTCEGGAGLRKLEKTGSYLQPQLPSEP
jgi:hypothetical protein